MEKINKSDQEFAQFFNFESITDVDIIDEDLNPTEDSTFAQPNTVAAAPQSFEIETLSPDVDIIDETNISEEDEESEEETEENTDVEIDVRVLKATAQGFAEKFGFDFDEKAITDIESFGEFADAFSDYITEAKIESYKNTNEELKTLIEIAEKGGSLKNLSKLYEERQNVLEADISTEEGQTSTVKAYYSSLGQSKEWINKHINRLKADGDLEAEALESQTKHQAKLKDEADKQAIQESKLIEKREREKVNKITTFGNTLVKKGINTKAAASVVDFVYKEAYKTEDGTILTAFDKKIIDLKNNPEELMETVQFLINREKYIQMKSAQINNVNVDKKFSTILKNQVNKRVGSVAEERTPQQSSTKALSMSDFIVSKLN